MGPGGLRRGVHLAVLLLAVQGVLGQCVVFSVQGDVRFRDVTETERTVVTNEILGPRGSIDVRKGAAVSLLCDSELYTIGRRKVVQLGDIRREATSSHRGFLSRFFSMISDAVRAGRLDPAKEGLHVGPMVSRGPMDMCWPADGAVVLPETRFVRFQWGNERRAPVVFSLLNRQGRRVLEIETDAAFIELDRRFMESLTECPGKECDLLWYVGEGRGERPVGAWQVRLGRDSDFEQLVQLLTELEMLERQIGPVPELEGLREMIAAYFIGRNVQANCSRD